MLTLFDKISCTLLVLFVLGAMWSGERRNMTAVKWGLLISLLWMFSMIIWLPDLAIAAGWTVK